MANLTKAKVFAIVAEKGGVGKTMISVTLAAIAACRGRSVALIDLDPQVSATNWGDRRELDNPVVVSCQVARLEKVIEAAIEGGVELIVIDTAGKATDAAIAASKAADFVLVPCQPNVSNLETLPKIKNILNVAGSPHAAVLINDAPIQGNRHLDAQEAVKSMGLEVAPLVIFHRVAHSDAGNIGQIAMEYAPDSKAALETIGLYDYMISVLYNEGKSNEQYRSRA